MFMNKCLENHLSVLEELKPCGGTQKTSEGLKHPQFPSISAYKYTFLVRVVILYIIYVVFKAITKYCNLILC